MYVFDTTGNGYDILLGHELIAQVDTIEAARSLCYELNKLVRRAANAERNVYIELGLLEPNTNDNWQRRLGQKRR